MCESINLIKNILLDSGQIAEIYVYQYLLKCLLRNNFYRVFSFWSHVEPFALKFTLTTRRISPKYVYPTIYCIHFSEKIWFANRHYLDAPCFFCESEKSAKERGGKARVNAYARKFAGVRAVQETRYIKYILNLYSRRERLAARPTLPSRRNTKFPYSDAPRQKLTLLRFIDPQYCVPPRGAPAVPVLRPRSNVHRFAPSRMHTRLYTTSRACTRTYVPSSSSCRCSRRCRDSI